MNSGLHEQNMMNYYQYRRDQLMEEARRERLKASVLRRAKQQRDVPTRFHVGDSLLNLPRVIAHGWRRVLATPRPPIVEDCLESAPTC